MWTVTLFIWDWKTYMVYLRQVNSTLYAIFAIYEWYTDEIHCILLLFVQLIVGRGMMSELCHWKNNFKQQLRQPDLHTEIEWTLNHICILFSTQDLIDYKNNVLILVKFWKFFTVRAILAHWRTLNLLNQCHTFFILNMLSWIFYFMHILLYLKIWNI